MATVLLPGSWQLSIASLFCVILLSLVVGLTPIMAIMESVYVMTEREIWKQIARFWGELFGILLITCVSGALVLAIAYVVTGGAITREAVAVLGSTVAILAIELLLFRRYFLDWWQITRLQHLAITLLMMFLPAVAVLAIAATGSWIVDSAGVDDVPVRIAALESMLLNPAAQLAFVHLLGACYLCAAALVLGVGAWYLLGRRNVQIAHRSMTVAASVGLAAALSLAVRGGVWNGDLVGHDGVALWAFRLMLAIGAYLIALFAVAFFLASKRKLRHDVFLRFAVGSLPLPWIAIVLGWLASQKRWWLGAIPAAMSTQAVLAALAFVLVVFVLKGFVITRLFRAVHGGPEQMKLWPADAGANARY